MCRNKKRLKNSRIFKNFFRFIYCKKIGGLGVANFKNLFSFEEIGNFRDFQVFDFSSYTEFENSETQKYFQDF